jgi:hypothetical protein
LPDEPYRFDAADALALQETPGLEQAHIHLVDGTLVCWAGIGIARALETLPALFDI